MQFALQTICITFLLPLVFSKVANGYACVLGQTSGRLARLGELGGSRFWAGQALNVLRPQPAAWDADLGPQDPVPALEIVKKPSGPCAESRSRSFQKGFKMQDDARVLSVRSPVEHRGDQASWPGGPGALGGEPRHLTALPKRPSLGEKLL